MASLIDAIKGALAPFNGKWGEKKGLWEFSTTIAEKRAFLSKKKLTYSWKMRIDDASRTVKFSEMLVEAGSGLSTGGDFDSEMSTGFGGKAGSYNTFKKSGEVVFQDQLQQYSKDYSFQFDCGEIRKRVQTLAEQAGYKFEYQVLPLK